MQRMTFVDCIGLVDFAGRKMRPGRQIQQDFGVEAGVGVEGEGVD